MAEKNLLGSQIRHLLFDVSGQTNQHLTEVETDLVQITFLLGEAIGKLGASFMAIHETVCAQQETVDLVLAGKALSPENIATLKSIQGEIGLHVSAAVTGLQFQDMTSQLIGRTVRRVTGLREILNVLGSSSSDVMLESDTEELIRLLSNINQVIDDQSEKLENLLWQAVRQTHMESGDIELF